MLVAGISLKQKGASDAQYNAFLWLFAQIRNDSRYQCPIVAIVESVACQTASYIASLLATSGLPNVFVMHERSKVNGEWREGVPKDEKITQEMANDLTRVMGIGYLMLAEDIITYKFNEQKGPENYVSHVNKELDKLKLMMQNFRYVKRKTVEIQARERFFITAKTASTQDDILIALCMCIKWRKEFWLDRSGKYTAAQRIIRSYRPSYTWPL